MISKAIVMKGDIREDERMMFRLLCAVTEQILREAVMAINPLG